MRHFYKLMSAALAVALAAGLSLAQRPRTIEKSEEEPALNRTTAPPPLPKVVQAKYMGGYLGYKKKQEGMLTFDDRNQRLVFRDKNEREIISLAYDAVLTTFADPEERQLMGQGTRDVMLGTLGPLALPGLLFKKKFEFMTIQYRDPDTDASGVTQFKLKSREELDAVVYALAQKAGLVQRGAIFVRKKGGKDAPASGEKPASASQTSTEPPPHN